MTEPIAHLTSSPYSGEQIGSTTTPVLRRTALNGIVWACTAPRLSGFVPGSRYPPHPRCPENRGKLKWHEWALLRWLFARSRQA
jgi:hypothetical protein